MAVRLDFDKPIFVIEHCLNCRTRCAWHTRHDEAKYRGYATDLSSRIREHVPDAIVLYNQVPKRWFEKEIYCQLVPNEDDNNDVYDMIPRMGAFEVSTVAERGSGGSEAVLLFSKLIGGLWPHVGDLAKRMATFCGENSKEESSNLGELR